MIRPFGSYTNAVPTPSPITRRRPDRPVRSCNVLTKTTAGSALAAKSAKLSGACTPGSCAGSGGVVASAVGAIGTGTAPEGNGSEPAAGNRLQPSAAEPIESAARRTRAFFTGLLL